MPHTARRAFVYAKSCGILAKSLLWGRRAELTAAAGLETLAALTNCTGKTPDALEKEFRAHAEKQTLDLLKALSAPNDGAPRLPAALWRKQEAADLSRVLTALSVGEAECPVNGSLEHFIPCAKSGEAAVYFPAYPDLRSMLNNTPYMALIPALTAAVEKSFLSENYIHFQSEVNKAYWNYFFRVLRETPRRECILLTKMIYDEIAMQNTAWALRLRIYYGMDAAAIEAFFVEPPNVPQPLARAARQSLRLAADHRGEWAGWKYAAFLNPEKSGGAWQLDPRYFQNKAALYLFRKAYSAFHRCPFTLDSAACFIYIKQMETQILTGIAEGLALGIAPAEILRMFEMEDAQ